MMFHDQTFLNMVAIEDRDFWHSQIEQARAGNVIAMNQIAAVLISYEQYDAAVYWLQKAGNYAQAQYELANLYFQGLGVPESEEKALALYKKAAQHGHADAANNLADMYLNGEGTNIDESQALYWFTQAANAGVVEAMYTLGIMYEQGLGTEKNDDLAFSYYLRAADGGYNDAQYRLGTIYLEGLLGKETNIQLAIEMFKLAANEHNVDALFNLGYLYAEPHYAIQDGKKAVHYYKRAALLGDRDAKIRLAELYESGNIVAFDEKEAQKWRNAANEIN